MTVEDVSNGLWGRLKKVKAARYAGLGSTGRVSKRVPKPPFSDPFIGIETYADNCSYSCNLNSCRHLVPGAKIC
jgi:hypothetical protein